MTSRTLALAVSALATLAHAQDEVTPPPAARAAAPVEATDALFYRAFFLERGERRFDEAIAAYREFLASNPAHRHAARAAKSAAQLLHRAGRTDEAKEVEKLVAAASAPADATASAPAAASGDAAPEPSGAGAAAAPTADAEASPVAAVAAARRRAQTQRLEAELSAAREQGDADNIARLERELAELRGERAAPEAGARPRNRAATEEGASRGDATRRVRGATLLGRRLAELTPAELTQLREQLAGVTAMATRLRDAGQSERADALDAKLAALNTALDAGDLDTAQKHADELREQLRRRRGERAQ